MNKHPQSWLPLEELGSHIPPYLPTYDFTPPFIDRTQRSIADSPRQDGSLIQMKNRRWFGKLIPGWLRPEDALKLYEMAYFADGDLLELGSFHGLSTAILAQACRNSQVPKRLHSIDLDPTCTTATQNNLRALGLQKFVTTRSLDATLAVREFAQSGTQFAFVFVDHSHAYAPVFEVCQSLEQILLPGGFCLFHDFNDIRNRDVLDVDYGVCQAVQDGLESDAFEFYGIYGCTGLYRRG